MPGSLPVLRVASLFSLVVMVTVPADAWSGNVCSYTGICYSRERVCSYRSWGSCKGYKWINKPSRCQKQRCCSGWTHNGNENCNRHIDECSSNPCENGGSCQDQFNAYTCNCVAGYTGNICETNINECTPNPCQNGGTCDDEVNGFTCNCEAGFTGNICETNINECTHDPCQNGGTCEDEVNGFTCNCVVGYTGTICETTVICGDLPEVSQGQWACPSGRQCPAVCTLTCAPGFRLVSPENVTCEQEGNWTSPGLCQDIQPPVFDSGCPANMEVIAARLGQETRVNLSQPAVSDNSGDVVRLSTDVISGSVFANGVTVVTYEAVDTSGNTNSCHTNVTVSVLDCGAPYLQPQSAQGPSPMHSSCPDGYVHGASCALTCLHGYRLQGQGSVTCERDDVTHPPSMTWQWSGSMAAEPRCREDRCPPLEPPINGALSCYHGDAGWDCYMSCERSWDVPAFSDGRLVCLNERQIWSPASAPDCVARVLPGRVRMMADLLYFTGSCNVSTDQLRNNFISHIRNTIYNGACASMPSCDAENIEVRCSSVPSRGRRNLDEGNTLMTRLHRFRRHGNMTSHFVIVTFHVTMPYVEEAGSPEEAFRSYNQSMTDCVQSYQVESHRLLSDLRAKVAAGQLDVDDLGLDLVADESGTVGEVAMHADCPPGTAYRVPRHPTRFSCLAE